MESITETIASVYGEFAADAAKARIGNKSAGRRARVKSLELEKLLLEFRKESVKWDR